MGTEPISGLDGVGLGAGHAVLLVLVAGRGRCRCRGRRSRQRWQSMPTAVGWTAAGRSHRSQRRRVEVLTFLCRS